MENTEKKDKQKIGRKILKINLVLFALLFGLVSFNKEILRPAFIHKPLINVFTGSFPNFIAAFIISLSIANAVLIRKPKNGSLIVYISSVFVFTVLAIEELFPVWGASIYYDVFDILASGLGSLLSIVTYKLVARKTQ